MRKPPAPKPHHKYRNVIFDLGGVLVRFDPKKLIEQTFRHRSETPWYLLEALRSKEFIELDRQSLPPEQIYDLLKPRYPHATFKEDFFNLFNAIVADLDPLPEGVKIFDTVRQRGFKTYILSNLCELTHNRIKDHDFLKSFDGGIFSYQVKLVKPEPEIYKTLLTRYALDADECIFIDDLEVNIQGAKNVGIDGIVCKDHDYVVEELKKHGILT
jgi:epoxide hydrolase-like predicted phosphatase